MLFTWNIVINLINALVVQFESPRMRPWDMALLKAEFSGTPLGPISVAHDLVLICPMPVRWWWGRIYLPRLKLAGRKTARISRLWVAIMVSRVIAESLKRLSHVFVTKIEAFL